MSKSKKRTSPKKTPETANSGRKKTAVPAVILNEERQLMIREAAYYLAEQRGFSSGSELGDWLQAESQVSASLAQKGE